MRMQKAGALCKCNIPDLLTPTHSDWKLTLAKANISVDVMLYHG